MPATGAVDFSQSRSVPSLGHVIEIGSNLQSDNKQVILGVNGVTVSGYTFQASYTYTRSRDQSSFSCCSATQGFAAATTAGNPNVPGWATSDYERRHSFLITASYALSQSVELTTVTRLMSGTPYTPMVSGDINGDGVANDRAFIFAASARDTAVANGMARLLASSSSTARSCLLSQTGSVANRNSCTGRWQPAADLQLNFRPSWWGLDRRMTIMLSTVNMLAGLDELLHGNNNLYGWGGSTRPDPTLLFVRGFDPTTQSFAYAVNQRFGSTRGSANAFRVPFQLALQARYVIGPDQNAERMRALFGVGGGRGGRNAVGGPGEGAAANSDDLADRLQRFLPNPADPRAEGFTRAHRRAAGEAHRTARLHRGDLRGDRGLDTSGRREGGSECGSRAPVRNHAPASHERSRDRARGTPAGAVDSHTGAVGEGPGANQSARR